MRNEVPSHLIRRFISSFSFIKYNPWTFDKHINEMYINIHI